MNGAYILYSLKRSDVTRWKQGFITPPSILHFMKRSDITRWKQGYIIVLASSVKTKEFKVIEFHRISGQIGEYTTTIFQMVTQALKLAWTLPRGHS